MFAKVKAPEQAETEESGAHKSEKGTANKHKFGSKVEDDGEGERETYGGRPKLKKKPKAQPVEM